MYTVENIFMNRMTGTEGTITGNYTKDVCYECNKEIITAVELINETDFINGYGAGRVGNKKPECFTCARSYSRSKVNKRKTTTC